MRKLLFYGIFVALLVACHKEENEEAVSKSEDGFTIENNYVRFYSKESFIKTMSALHKLSTSELPKWEKEHGIQNSLRSKQWDTTKTIDVENMLVQDMRFASVINEDGVYAIGDSIHKITQDKEYVYRIGTSVSSTTLGRSSSGVRVFLIKKQILNLDAPLDNNVIKTRSMADQYVYYDQTQMDIPPSSAKGTRRVRFYAWSTSYIAYCSNGIGMHSQFRTKNFWGQLYWKDSPMAYMGMSGYAWYLYNGFDKQKYSYDSDTNEYNEQCTIAYEFAGTIYTYRINAAFGFNLNSKYPFYYYNTIWN